MLCIPKANHRKLVDDCYPPSKTIADTAPEYRPNSNELGRLTYYAQNKPSKLTKVGRLLTAHSLVERAAMSGTGGARAKAGLMITLGILHELVKVGPLGLSYLAPTVQSVLTTALQAAAPHGAQAAWDAEVSERAAKTFSTYAESLPVGAMELDERIPASIYGILSQLQPMVRGNGDEGARLVGLGAMDGVVRSTVMHSPAFPQLAQAILPGVLETISPSHLPLTQTEALVDAAGAVKAVEGGASPVKSTAAALVLLRELVHHADAVQVRTLVDQTLAWFGDGKQTYWASEAFSVWLFSMLTLWAARASRYAVPHTLIDALSSRDGRTLRSTRLLQALHVILANKIEVVGLDMTQLLDGHLAFLLTHVQTDPNDPLIGATIQAVGDLGQHTVYADQLVDFVQQINTHIAAVQASGPPLTPVQRDNSLRALLYCQVALVLVATGSKKAQASTPVPLSVWIGTETLLLSPSAAVRYTYLQTLLIFLAFTQQAKQGLVRGEAAYAPQSESLRFLHAFMAYAYAVLSRTLLNGGASELVALDGHRHDLGGVEAVPADFALVLDVLEALYAAYPAQALLATVPALLALDREAAQPTSDPTTLPTRRAVRWVVGTALAKLGTLWNVPSLVSYVQDHILRHVTDAQPRAPAFAEAFGAAPSLAPFAASSASAGPQVPNLDTVAEYLATSPTLQAATRCDMPTLHEWLLRHWTVAVAIQDAQLSAQPTHRAPTSGRSSSLAATTAPSTSRVPPSLLRDGSINVQQFRQALLSRGPSRAGTDPSAGVETPLPGHMRRRSRTASQRELNGKPSVADLLNKYHVGEGAPEHETTRKHSAWVHDEQGPSLDQSDNGVPPSAQAETSYKSTPFFAQTSYTAQPTTYGDGGQAPSSGGHTMPSEGTSFPAGTPTYTPHTSTFVSSLGDRHALAGLAPVAIA